MRQLEQTRRTVREHDPEIEVALAAQLLEFSADRVVLRKDPKDLPVTDTGRGRLQQTGLRRYFLKRHCS